MKDTRYKTQKLLQHLFAGSHFGGYYGLTNKTNEGRTKIRIISGYYCDSNILNTLAVSTPKIW